MNYPEFYDRVETITLLDPLSDFLGAFDEGVIEYTYLDAVKLAGHSCPTVAGAYLATLKGLKALYGDEMPVRGQIKVEMKEDITEGVTGVIANVISLLTGATSISGFKGIGGSFDRRNLLAFNANIDGLVRFSRVDTGQSVTVEYNAGIVLPSPRMQPLMQKIMMGQAGAEESQAFRALWQERVEKILCDFADNPKLVVVK